MKTRRRRHGVVIGHGVGVEKERRLLIWCFLLSVLTFLSFGSFSMSYFACDLGSYLVGMRLVHENSCSKCWDRGTHTFTAELT